MWWYIHEIKPTSPVTSSRQQLLLPPKNDTQSMHDTLIASFSALIKLSASHNKFFHGYIICCYHLRTQILSVTNRQDWLWFSWYANCRFGPSVRCATGGRAPAHYLAPLEPSDRRCNGWDWRRRAVLSALRGTASAMKSGCAHLQRWFLIERRRCPPVGDLQVHG